jgi:hypothetical protein
LSCRRTRGGVRDSSRRAAEARNAKSSCLGDTAFCANASISPSPVGVCFSSCDSPPTPPPLRLSCRRTRGSRGGVRDIDVLVATRLSRLSTSSSAVNVSSLAPPFTLLSTAVCGGIRFGGSRGGVRDVDVATRLSRLFTSSSSITVPSLAPPFSLLPTHDDATGRRGGVRDMTPFVLSVSLSGAAVRRCDRELRCSGE